MSARDPGRRHEVIFPLMIAIGIPVSLAGCGESGSAPAPVDAAQQQKVQNYMSGYREQIIADNKAKAKAKANPKTEAISAEKPAH
jgi:hypothetical protein